MARCSHGGGCCCGGQRYHHHGCGCGYCPRPPPPHPHHCQEPYRWEHASRGHIPPNAVLAGHDSGKSTFAARAWHEGDLLPAKLPTGHGCAFISWDGKEIRKLDYEVLVSTHNVSWIHESQGRVPMCAVPAGRTRSGEELYLGRAHHMGTLTPGKVHPSHHCLYMPYGGREIAHQNYEVLVIECRHY